MEPHFFAKIVISLLFAICFLQSGIDKVQDWKGNLDWLTGHFSKTFLAPFVLPMLATVTVLEIAAGILCTIGTVMLLIDPLDNQFSIYGLQLSALSLLMLFFGQRIAKDYAGASTLVIYFIAAVFGLYVI